MLRRSPPRRIGPGKRQLLKSQPGLFPANIPDTRSGIRVIAYWPGPWAARRAAQILSYLARDASTAYENIPIWRARPKYAPLFRNRYFRGPTLDTSTEYENIQGFLARPKYAPLYRSRFQFFGAPDEPVVAGEDELVPIWLARPRYAPLYRSRFQILTALDEPEAVVEEEFVPIWLAHPRFVGLSRNRNLFTLATDPDIVVVEFEQVPQWFVRWMRQPYDARRASFLLHTFTTQDLDAPAGPPDDLYMMRHHHYYR